MGDVVQFPSRPRSRLLQSTDALPVGIDFYAVLEALGPGSDGKPTGWAVLFLERRKDGAIASTEASRFDTFDQAMVVADRANRDRGATPGGAA